MNVELFDFDLPKASIALRPASPRDSARMLVVKPAEMSNSDVLSLGDHLNAGDVLVFNDTKVIPGRLYGTRGKARIEVTLHKRAGAVEWQVFARPAKKCRLGDRLKFGDLEAEVIGVGEAGERTLRFDLTPDAMMPALVKCGEMPLPPYIASQRPIDERDAEDYQTMFADKEGAVAAPTASLHFTQRLLDLLKAKGIKIETLTLHVGAGTFLPVKVDDTDDHQMHSEWGSISKGVADRLNLARTKGGKVVAVGTTCLRLLESAVTSDGKIEAFEGDTAIFITPGYRFRAVDALMTNFHLPKSTLFMLVAAFAGFDRMKQAYNQAITDGYRFYSYGDSSILFPKDEGDV